MSGRPECYVCGDPCVCGQVDAHAFPAHLGCQSQLPPAERNPRLAEYPTSFGLRWEDREKENTDD